MKLYETPPDGVTVDGRFYALDFDFRNVLRLLEILDRDDLMPDARDYLALKCLTKRPRNVGKVLQAAKAALFERGNGAGERVMSFEQDAGLIRAAFRQTYHIDLTRERLHWLTFIELLHNLPEGNRFCETVSIRSRPLPPATKYNTSEREWLQKAKAQCALHMTEAEAARKYDKDVGNVFAGIMGMIKKDVTAGNGK